MGALSSGFGCGFALAVLADPALAEPGLGVDFADPALADPGLGVDFGGVRAGFASGWPERFPERFAAARPWPAFFGT